jgi:hypothetical protein
MLTPKGDVADLKKRRISCPAINLTIISLSFTPSLVNIGNQLIRLVARGIFLFYLFTGKNRN